MDLHRPVILLRLKVSAPVWIRNRLCPKITLFTLLLIGLQLRFSVGYSAMPLDGSAFIAFHHFSYEAITLRKLLYP